MAFNVNEGTKGLSIKKKALMVCETVACPLIRKSHVINNEVNHSISKESAIEDSNLDFENNSGIFEHRSSVISSIELKSSSKPNDDSIFSLLNSEKSITTKRMNEGSEEKKKNSREYQLEIVNFIPGAILKKKEKFDSCASLNQSSESINAKAFENATTRASKIELIDSKTLEEKNYRIIDKYIKQSNAFQSKDTEGTIKSIELFPNLQLPKGKFHPDYNHKLISGSTKKIINKNPDEMQTTSCLPKDDTPIIKNINNNFHINNYNLQRCLNNPGYFPTPNMPPFYPQVVPDRFFSFNYPIQANQHIPYQYNLNDQGIYYQTIYGNNAGYYTNPFSYPINSQISNQVWMQEIQSNHENLNQTTINVLKAVRDQNECRSLQVQLEKDPSISRKILPQVLQYFIILCNDPFGNYLVQRVIEFLNEEELEAVVTIAIENFNDIILNNCGTRVVQKLIEVANQSQLNRLSVPLKYSMLSLYKNQNGIHIITKYVSKSKNANFVFDFLYSNIVVVSKNKDSCCMIQKILENSTSVKKVIYILIIAASNTQGYFNPHIRLHC